MAERLEVLKIRKRCLQFYRFSIQDEKDRMGIKIRNTEEEKKHAIKCYVSYLIDLSKHASSHAL